MFGAQQSAVASGGRIVTREIRDPDERPQVWVGHITLATPDIPLTRDFMIQLGMRRIADGDDFAILELRGGTHLVLVPAVETASGPAGRARLS